jgi:GDSL-like Lipase/Acylhydrolase family
VGAGLLAFGTARNFQVGMARQALLVGGPILLGVGILVCLRLPLPGRVALAMTLLSLVVAAYTAEAYLKELPFLRVRLAARRFGIPFDARSQFEVVRDLRETGAEVYPVTFPAWQGLPSEDAALLPLGGISRVTTIFCNEMGQYAQYRSDEHGFRNPEGIWSSPRMEVAVLGDSFAQGACVPTEQNFVELLRRRYPATLNLGMVGNGPLLMLAGLKEFLTEIRPGIVLWVYTEGNDLTFDLNREKRFTRLTDYLLPGHRQGLLRRQPECDSILRGWVDREYASRQTDTMELLGPGRFLRLWSLRQALGLQVGEIKLDSSRVDLRLFKQILADARKTTLGWGGRLFFVYLPAEARYHDAKSRRKYDWLRGEVLSIVENLHLPLIDLHPAFSRQPDLAELYAHRGAHFGPAGYRLVARTILEALHSSTDN